MFTSARRLTSYSFMGAFVAACTNYDFANLPPTNVSCFTEPPGRDYIRGQYENKIRMMSPPEKIFEVFATQKKGKNIYMSHLDLFQALCPYNYTTKPRDYSHSESQKSFESSALVQFADSDRNGEISLYEYYIFVAFMQTTTEDFIRFFGSLQDRPITRDELSRFIRFIQGIKTENLTIPKYMPDPRRQHLKAEEFQEVQEQIVNNLFEGKETIQLSKLLNLRELIYKELYTFEFRTFEADENGNISGEDFAKSIICYLDPAVVNKYWRSLDKVVWDGTITLEQYIAFQRMLRENLKVMEERIQEKGVLSRKKLRELISEYSTSDSALISDTQLNILMRVLDLNGNNRIDHDEFVGVVKSRTFYGSAEPSQNLEKPFVVLKNKGLKMLDKLARIYEILAE